MCTKIVPIVTQSCTEITSGCRSKRIQDNTHKKKTIKYKMHDMT